VGALAFSATARSEEALTAPAFGNRPGWAGLGVNVGNLLTGVTAKLWASPRVAGQVAAGGGPLGNDLKLHADVTFSPVLWASPDGQYLLPLYAGLGGALGHSFASGATPSSTAAGFRVPVGMSVLVRGNPIELFLEVAPELMIRTATATDSRYLLAADGAIGFRYYL
jgi:hypothetical protein